MAGPALLGLVAAALPVPLALLRGRLAVVRYFVNPYWHGPLAPGLLLLPLYLYLALLFVDDLLW